MPFHAVLTVYFTGPDRIVQLPVTSFGHINALRTALEKYKSPLTWYLLVFLGEIKEFI